MRIMTPKGQFLYQRLSKAYKEVGLEFIHVDQGDNYHEYVEINYLPHRETIYILNTNITHERAIFKNLVDFLYFYINKEYDKILDIQGMYIPE